MEEIVLSNLNKTWILDLDGTIVKYSGHKIDGYDTFLPGAKEFLLSISSEDFILFITARSEKYKEQTIRFLKGEGVRYNQIIFGVPLGERILMNDIKPSGLKTAYAINVNRNQFEEPFVKKEKVGN